MAVRICDLHLNTNQEEIRTYDSGDFPIACYEDDMQQITVPLHWHEEYEYIIATQGTVVVYANSDSVELQEGQAVFINSDCLHGVRSATEESVLRSLVILPKVIAGTYDNAIFKQTVAPLHQPDAPSYVLLQEDTDWQKEIGKSMLRAWDAISEETYDYENEARYQISKALHLLVDHLPDADSHRIDHALLDRVKRSISYMEENYAKDISNLDLMELLGCSESMLLRSFKQIVHTSPMQYLLNFRMQKAAELLLTTDLKSCDIASSCGFRDVSYFTKIFKREIGATPIAYRERN